MTEILVVDDSRFSRLHVVRILKEAGFSITEADCGEQALAFISESAFDVVVTDMLMPNVDGLELLTRLRQAGNAIPVIVVSADIQESTQAACEEQGIHGFLNKPCKRADLLALIASATTSPEKRSA